MKYIRSKEGMEGGREGIHPFFPSTFPLLTLSRLAFQNDFNRESILSPRSYFYSCSNLINSPKEESTDEV